MSNVNNKKYCVAIKDKQSGKHLGRLGNMGGEHSQVVKRNIYAYMYDYRTACEVAEDINESNDGIIAKVAEF